MKINKKVIAAGASATALTAILFGGSTTALWSDAVTLDGGTITAGNLDVAALASGDGWQDVSDDVLGADATNAASAAGNGVDINLDDYRIVPGDTIQNDVDIAVALEGDNMLATLGLDAAADASGNLLAGTAVDVDPTESDPAGAPVPDQDATSMEGLELFYSLTDAAGAPVLDADGNAITDVAFNSDVTMNLTPDTDGVVAALPADLSTATATFNLKVRATFDEDTPERTRVMAAAALSEIGVSLTQVRATV